MLERMRGRIDDRVIHATERVPRELFVPVDPCADPPLGRRKAGRMSGIEGGSERGVLGEL